MRKKAIFILPGFKHRPNQKSYKKLATLLKKQGYKPIPIEIPWRQTTIAQNTDYFLKQYKKFRFKNKYILGFSFGAMIAFVASTKVNVTGLMLCSMSPYFKEDKKNSDLCCSVLAKQIKAKRVHLFYGAKESRQLIKRVKKTYQQIPIKHKYLIPIQNTEHNIGDRRYLQMIYQTTQSL